MKDLGMRTRYRPYPQKDLNFTMESIFTCQITEWSKCKLCQKFKNKNQHLWHFRGTAVDENISNNLKNHSKNSLDY